MIGTVTTVTTMAGLGLTSVVSIAIIAPLIFFLITRELAGARSSDRSLRIAKFVSVGILPLMMAFTVIVFMKIIEVLA